MKIDLNILKPYLEKRLISEQKHPTSMLSIFNYTQVCQFGRNWDEVTLMCRGLIVDAFGTVIARPYDKFFNREEKPDEIPNTTFKAYDKADGSLGILYKTDAGYALATRGSFISEQAIEGTKMLQDIKYDFKDGLTYLFEIIYPQNRIVIDYHGERKLVLLGARDIETGKIYTPDEFPDYPYEKALEVKDFDKPRDNAEGVVLYFQNGYMSKVKYEEYVRLHRLVTGINARRIWDLLRTGQSIDDLVERVPEEFEEWVKNTAKDIRDKYESIEKNCKKLLKEVSKMESRKEQAIHLMKNNKDDSGVIFSMLDDKPYADIIWKRIKPEHEVPFRKDIDA